MVPKICMSQSSTPCTFTGWSRRGGEKKVSDKTPHSTKEAYGIQVLYMHGVRKPHFLFSESVRQVPSAESSMAYAGLEHALLVELHGTSRTLRVLLTLCTEQTSGDLVNNQSRE